MGREIPIKCEGNRYLSYDELKDFQGNLKKLTKENLEKLKKSIIQFGWVAPVFVWNGNYIIDGHGRLKALRELIKEGYTIGKIPVVDIYAETKEEAGRILLAINSHYQQITEEGIQEFISNFSINIEELNDFVLTDIDLEGFLKEATKKEEDEAEDEDEVPEVNEEPITKLGDLYILGGKHRVLCGDATIRENVELLMDGKKADMVFTDPPYGMNLNTNFKRLSTAKSWRKGKHYRPVIGDDRKYDPSHLFRDFGYVKEMFLWGADYYAELIPNRDKGSWIVWDKRAGIEDAFFMTSEFELCWSKQKHHRRIARFAWFGAYGMQFEEREEKKGGGFKRVHPNQKPVRLIKWFFEQWGKSGDIVVDLFLGSGSTIIACDKMGRVCYGMEIDPLYCDIIIERWCRYTGQRDIIKNGEPIKWGIKNGK
jgi:DNA modification methylase